MLSVTEFMSNGQDMEEVLIPVTASASECEYALTILKANEGAFHSVNVCNRNDFSHGGGYFRIALNYVAECAS